MKFKLFLLSSMIIIAMIGFASANLEIFGGNKSNYINLGASNICASICTNLNVSAIFNETDPIQPWTNDSSQIFPKLGFPQTIKTTTTQTNLGFLVDGNVTDGFVTQGTTDLSAIANAFSFGATDSFQPTSTGKEYWGFLSGSYLNSNVNVDEFIGFLSSQFATIAQGRKFTGAVTNFTYYDAEPYWAVNGTAINFAIYKSKPIQKLSGNITNLYGLWLPDINAGDTINYAIKTGLGKVIFGDNVTAPNICYSNGTNCFTSGVNGLNIFFKNESNTLAFNVIFNNGTLKLKSPLTNFSATIINSPGAIKNNTWTIPSGNDDTFVGASSLTSGTYVPVISANINVDVNVTMTTANYIIVGSLATVSGRFTADPTLITTATSFEVSLPSASSFTNVYDAAGTAVSGNVSSMSAEVIGVPRDPGATAKIQWKSTDITLQTWSYIYQYRIQASLA